VWGGGGCVGAGGGGVWFGGGLCGGEDGRGVGGGGLGVVGGGFLLVGGGGGVVGWVLGGGCSKKITKKTKQKTDIPPCWRSAVGRGPEFHSLQKISLNFLRTRTRFVTMAAISAAPSLRLTDPPNSPLYNGLFVFPLLLAY